MDMNATERDTMNPQCNCNAMQNATHDMGCTGCAYADDSISQDWTTDAACVGDRVRAFHPGMFGVIREGLVTWAGQTRVRVNFGETLGGSFQVPREHVTAIIDRPGRDARLAADGFTVARITEDEDGPLWYVLDARGEKANGSGWMAQSDADMDAVCHAAAVLGTVEGKRAADDFRIDAGLDNSAACVRIRDGLDECDPEVMDYLPRPDFSMQWAEGDTVPAMIERAGITLSAWKSDGGYVGTDEVADTVADAYESAFADAVSIALECYCRDFLASIEPLDRDARYQVEGFGAAVYVTDQPTADSVTVVMVGDDAPHVIDRDQLTLIDADAYCSECGQIGCRADGRGEDGSVAVLVSSFVGVAMFAAFVLPSILHAYAAVAAILP